MPEPVDSAEDWLIITGAADRVTFAQYRPGSDDWATAVPVYLARDAAAGTEEPVGEGTTRVTRTTWRGVFPDRPLIRSKVTERDGSVWSLTGVNPDAGDGVYACPAVLL